MVDKDDKEKIEKMQQDIIYTHEAFSSRGSKAYEAFLRLLNEASKKGRLEEKYKQLICTGISLAINCEPCQAYHIREALRKGATEVQVAETIEAALETCGGPIVLRSGYAFKVLEYLKEKEGSKSEIAAG